MYSADIESRKESPLFYLNTELLNCKSNSSSLRISEVSNNAYFVLRGDKNSTHLEAALYKHLKLYLPQEPKEMAKSASAKIFYISFDEWLIVVDEALFARVDVSLRADLSGHFQLVDNSGGMTQLYLCGADVQEVMQKVCSYDLHPRQFPIGACVQTKIAKSSGLVVRVSEFGFALYIRRSFSYYIASWCIDAAREYG
ncbi:MAG: sarcosine oxidase subunit gamma family protein [Coxiellaceae bacterium]|nr:sarcosine oxidase subunit gamma family protein [Coxiellaceae bacterium]